MRTLAAAGVLLAAVFLTGCGASEADEQYDSAMANCIRMADEAMPNGMLDPEDPNIVFDSPTFCEKLASGMSRETFAKQYNDREWLASELEIWTGEGIP